METCGELLRLAIKFERQGAWQKVISRYIQLISRLLAASAKHRVNESNFRMLLYECHYHCATAYCHLEQTSSAIQHYESAIKVINQKKINCCVGCINGRILHLHVPALAKIAIRYLQLGEYEMALKRTEEALQLDEENPDLFCIKASSWFLCKDMAKTMKDINFAIWLNPKHVCAWMLRGFFKAIKRHKNCQFTNKDFEMASDLDSSTLAYMNNINTSKLHHILDRYLPSLRVSHTTYPENVTDAENDIQRAHDSKKVAVRTTPGTLSRRKCLSNEMSQDMILRTRSTIDIQRKKEPFVCGMTSSFHRKQQQTLSKAKENPIIDYYSTDILQTSNSKRQRPQTMPWTKGDSYSNDLTGLGRTKSAPDVRCIDHLISPLIPSHRQLDQRIKQSVSTIDTLQRSHFHSKNTISLHRQTMTAFAPWKNKCESSRLAKTSKSPSKVTHCYSKVTIGDLLNARITS